MRNYLKNNLPHPIRVETVTTVFTRTLTRCKPPFSPDVHDFCEFLYLDKGEVQLLVDDTPHTLHEGQMILYSPNAVHCFLSCQTPRICIASFSVDPPDLPIANQVHTLTAWQRNLIAQIMTLGADCLSPEPPKPIDLHGMPFRPDADVLKLQYLKNSIELLLIDLCTTTHTTTPSRAKSNSGCATSDIFASLTEFLAANLEQSPNLSELCAALSISPTKLNDICREHCGMSPKEYLLSLKIRTAKDMIRHTSLNFTEIAQHLGFSSIHYFSRLFREKTGMTPTQYALSVIDPASSPKWLETKQSKTGEPLD